MRLRLRTSWLVLLPVFVAGGVASFLLLVDIDVKPQVRQSNPVGRLTRFDGKVRYKPRGGFSWRDAQADQPLFKGDLIITGQESTALIETDDGQKLQLRPGSSVVLDSMKDIKSPAIKGSVVLSGLDGQEQLLGTDDLGAEPRFSIHLSYPEDLEDVFFDGTAKETAPVRFTWKAARGAPEPRAIQVADDRFFETGIRQAEVTDPLSLQAFLPVHEGKQFWRLVDSEGRALSPYRQFQGRTASALAPAAPVGSAIAWDDTIDFQWTIPANNTTEAGSHWIEISTTEDFASLVQKKAIPGLSLRSSIHGLAPGKYFWRLTSRFGSLTLASPARAITVEKGRQLTLEPLAPTDRAVASAGGDVLFRWSSNSAKATYVLELDSLGAPPRQVDSLNSSLAITDLKPGQYRWRIRGTLGNLRAESAWSTLTVLTAGTLSLSSPRPGERVVAPFPGAAISFSWLKPSDANPAGYLLELSTDPDFRKVTAAKKVDSTHATSSGFNLRPGTEYFWRVTALDQEDLGRRMSAPSSFKFSVYQALAAPNGLLPQEDVVCNPLKSKQACRFSWDTLDNAASYEIEFFPAGPGARAPASDESARPSLKASLSNPVFSLKSFSVGTYYWRVRAIDQGGRPGSPTPLRRFRYELGSRLSAPRSRSSEVQ